MAPVGDSAGAGEVSTPVGAARGTARLGDIIARDIGAVIMVGIMDIIITIIIVLVIIVPAIKAVQVAATEAMLLQEEIHPAAIVHEVVVHPVPGHLPCVLQVLQDLPAQLHH